MAFGQLEVVVCSIGTIRMWDIIPMPLYLICPTTAVAAVTIVLLLLPRASRCYDDSSKLLKTWTNVTARGAAYENRLLDKRVLMEYRACHKAIIALRPCKIFANISGVKLFMGKRSTKTTFLSSCVDAIVDGLVTSITMR